MEKHTDKYGTYMDVQVKGVTFRMRWIEPGEFLMGSPESEEYRSSDEFQHKVILTEGYWMADTTCTQELWQAVMETNPSKFKGNQLPVDSVSWYDCIKFLKRLNELIPEIEFRLPTEAEWEYACRAGTTTPFSFGEDITTEQVNYDGQYPYAGTETNETSYRRKTVEVKSLPCNQWGLYEMHGNVWEWCSDWYSEDYYQNSPLKDPKGAQPDPTTQSEQHNE